MLRKRTGDSFNLLKPKKSLLNETQTKLNDRWNEHTTNEDKNEIKYRCLG